MAEQVHIPHRWYRLDNAAKLYPAIRSRKNPATFRVSATLKKPVDPNILQQALDDTLQRLPGFSVRIRSGFFWPYFLQTADQLKIQEDVVNPCMDFQARENKGYRIRVRYFDRNIALEVFHSITDGSGAMVFLKTLVGRYLQLQGVSITPETGMLDCSGTPQDGELEDSFRDFAGSSIPRSRREKRAYHVRGFAEPGPILNIISGTIPTDAVRVEAKKYGVTVTEYLVSVLLFTLYQIQQKDHPRNKRPVKVSVPVNLRQFFPTKTLRNFSSYVNPGLDPTQGEYHFEEVVRLVHHFIRYEATEKQLRGKVAANVKSEKSIFIRLVPLFVKNFVISLVYNNVGQSRFTSTLSNLGRVEVPREMVDHVERFDLILGPSRITRVSCGVVGYNGTLRINFSRVFRETFVERGFFTFLVRQGIPVRIESNME